MIHSQTLKLNIVDKLSHLGICISKNRLLQISTAMGNTAIETYEKEGVIAPMNLRLGLFSTAAVDNIDVNPKSSTSTKSLHGTEASIHQHVSRHNIGIARDLPLTLSTDKKLKQIPVEYTEIMPAYLPSITQF